MKTCPASLSSAQTRSNALEILAQRLCIDPRVAQNWLRGDFRQQNVTGEQFVRFVQIYRGKQGLSEEQDVIDLAVYLYGDRFKQKLALVDIDPDHLSPDLPGQGQFGEADPIHFISNNLAASIARGIIGQYGNSANFRETYEHQSARHFQIPLINPEIRTVVAVAMQNFTETETLAFTALGALPRLGSYSRQCFGFLWEQEEAATGILLKLFENSNLIHSTQAGTWVIDAQVLRVSEHYLLSLSTKAQKRSRNWWKRALANPEIRMAFGNAFNQNNGGYISLFSVRTLRERRKRLRVHDYRENNLFVYLLKRLFIPGYNSDWEYMRNYSPHLTSDQYLYASFLLTYGKRKLRLFLLDVLLDPHCDILIDRDFRLAGCPSCCHYLVGSQSLFQKRLFPGCSLDRFVGGTHSAHPGGRVNWDNNASRGADL